MGPPFQFPVAQKHLKWGDNQGPKAVGVHTQMPMEVLLGTDLESWAQATSMATQNQKQKAPNIGSNSEMKADRHL